ncbi:MAG: EAL domain-containing protein [Lachnospiraceae bacterium]|nr:EAL domain-containing protein [Lachnospiraceae bacterium]
MFYNIHYDICAIIVHVFALFFVVYKKEIRRVQNKVYLTILVTGLVTTIFDLLSAITNSYMTESKVILGMLFNYGYLLLHNIMPILFCIYIVVVSGSYMNKTKVFYIQLFMPTVITIILFILNPFNNGIFYYNDKLEYCHGTLMIWLYVIAAFYMALCVFLIIRNSSLLSKGKKRAMIILLAGTVISIGIQSVYGSLLIEMFIQGLAYLGILFTIENEDELRNGITGIYNRKGFISENIIRIKNNIKYTVITVKLTNLKYYSSLVGIMSTNELLKDIAMWLDTQVPNCAYDCDNCSFSVVLNKYTKEDVEKTIDLFKEKLSEDWIFNDMKLALNSNIYIINIPEDVDTIERLMGIVDSEYESESDNKVTLIRGEKLNMFQRERKIQEEIQKALINREFKVLYQPIWDKESDTIHSAEALVRMPIGELGFISPEEFIPISEKTGDIIEIGEFVFEEVCKMFSEHNVKQYGVEFIEVNLSTVQCMQRNLAKRFKEILDKYNVSASSINLEITESAAANSPEMFINTMSELKKLGFTFSMDDYGTGYSNLSHMYDTDFDIIKLDKSILWNSYKSKKADIILQNTVKMIKEMEHNIVIEGVETEEQKEYVSRLGCDYCQGYYFSKPVAKEEFIEYCKKYNKC